MTILKIVTIYKVSDFSTRDSNDSNQFLVDGSLQPVVAMFASDGGDLLDGDDDDLLGAHCT